MLVELGKLQEVEEEISKYGLKVMCSLKHDGMNLMIQQPRFSYILEKKMKITRAGKKYGRFSADTWRKGRFD